MDEFYIGQIIEGEYPEGLVDWCNANNATISELESVEKDVEIELEDMDGNKSTRMERKTLRRFEVVEIPEPTEEEIRQDLDLLTLTPADVERALYDAKGMDFEDLKALISSAIPTIDLKGLAIEFRAKDFWRGATLKDGTRIFDVVGALLGYTPKDMDYLFQNKVLPTVALSDTVE